MNNHGSSFARIVSEQWRIPLDAADENAITVPPEGRGVSRLCCWIDDNVPEGCLRPS
jgi:hypothetical protein